MSGQRALIVGGQALIVGALLAVIYFTLLKPDDDGTLFGVDAPQDRPQVEQQPARDGDREKPDRRGERRRPSGDTPAAAAAELVTAIPGGGPLQAGAPEANGGPSGDDQTPGDDQYQDTLARLRALLGQSP